MWICTKCGFSNADNNAVCDQCGARRSAGRFSRSIQPKQTPRAQYVPDFSHVRSGKGLIITGMTCSLIFPAVIIVLALLFRDKITVFMEKLLFSDISATKTDEIKLNILYWVLSVCIAAAASLPGLCTAGIGKLLRRLNRIEELV